MIAGIIFAVVYVLGVYWAWYILRDEDPYLGNEHLFSEKAAKRIKKLLK